MTSRKFPLRELSEPMLDQIEELLDLYPDYEELFETLDITPYEVIDILVKHGYVSLPDYLRR